MNFPLNAVAVQTEQRPKDPLLLSSVNIHDKPHALNETHLKETCLLNMNYELPFNPLRTSLTIHTYLHFLMLRFSVVIVGLNKDNSGSAVPRSEGEPDTICWVSLFVA